jgi:hypothetical protein
MCRRAASAAAKYLCSFMFLFNSVLGQSQNSTPISAPEPAATGYLVACVSTAVAMFGRLRPHVDLRYYASGTGEGPDPIIYACCEVPECVTCLE